jgi:hypothetical protein
MAERRRERTVANDDEFPAPVGERRQDGVLRAAVLDRLLVIIAAQPIGLRQF